MSYAQLHIYPQEFEHCDATIIGTRNGLLALRDAITEALEKGNSEATLLQNDGEGYSLRLACASDQWMQAMPTSYLYQGARNWSETESAAFLAALDGRAASNKQPPDGIQT